jgi:hypothetical protein
MRDVRQVHLDRAAEPEVYTPIAQNWSQVSELGMTLVVSTRRTRSRSQGDIRTVVRDVSRDLAVFDVKTMTRVVDDSLADFTLYLGSSRPSRCWRSCWRPPALRRDRVRGARARARVRDPRRPRREPPAPRRPDRP